MHTPLLEAKSLTKRYGGVTALNGLSMTVNRGQVLGVMGPNGAGKSTLLKALMGEVRLDSGAVHIDGVDMTRYPVHRVVRHGVAMANQIPQPFSGLTVRQNLQIGSQHHARGQQAYVDEVLELCGLSEKSERVARSLGLLDLKRLELARALREAETALSRRSCRRLGGARGRAAHRDAPPSARIRSDACRRRAC